MEPVITMRSVDHFYGSGDLRRQVLHDVTASIQPGEIVILTGPSGSGKTTLLTLAGALRSVEHGSVSVLGQELHGASSDTQVRIRTDIGFIFQSHNLLDALTARQNVQMSLKVDPSTSPAEAFKKATYMLHAVGLGDKVDYLPGNLSGGQRQRVAVARALVRRPKIVLADEPTASLDKTTGREIVDLLHQLAKMQGCAILLVTHDNRILDVADRVLTLEDGRLDSLAAGMEAHTGHLLTAFAKLERQGEILEHLSGLSAQKFFKTLEQMTTEFQQFIQVNDLIQSEALDTLFEQVLAAVTNKIIELLEAERGTIFLLDHAQRVLRSTVARAHGEKPLQIEIPMTSGIAGRVAIMNQTLNVSDPYQHPDFDKSVDEKTGFYTRSILCVPIHNRERTVFAVAELLNKKTSDAFTEQDEQRLRSFDEPLGAILEGCLRLQARQAHNMN